MDISALTRDEKATHLCNAAKIIKRDGWGTGSASYGMIGPACVVGGIRRSLVEAGADPRHTHYSALSQAGFFTTLRPFMDDPATDLPYIWNDLLPHDTVWQRLRSKRKVIRTLRKAAKALS